MQYQWIIDVLTDLKAFANSNGLVALAEQLDDTSIVAAAEISQVAGIETGGLALDADEAGRLHRDATAGDFAR